MSRTASGLAVAAWLAWAVVVSLHYFAVPSDELLIFVEGRLRGFPYWREAAGRAAQALAGAGLVLAAAWGIGHLITHPLRDRFTAPAERVVSRLSFGLAALGVGMFALAGAGLYRPRVVTGVLFVCAAVALALLLRGGVRGPRLRVQPSVDVLYLCAAGLAVAFAFIGALAPETEYDALWYHLWLPALWLEAGRPVDVIEEYISLYPLGWDLVGGAAMAAGGPIAAKLLHFSCLPLLGVSTWLLTQRLAPGASPALAAALAVVTPLTIWEATTAYLDLAVAWYLASSVYALLRYQETRARGWLLTSAVTMGAALATKHLALVALAIVTPILLVREFQIHRRYRRAAAVTVLFVSVALVPPAPWYVRAYAASGNPVFPDMYSLFGARPAERWSPDAERGLAEFKARFGPERTPANLLRLPWDMTVHAASFGGTLGPIFLILVPAAFIGARLRRPVAVAGLGALAFLAVWASPVSSFQMRFLVPLVPILAALGAEGARRLQAAGERARRGGGHGVPAVTLALLLLNLPPASGWHEPDRDGWTGWMTHILRGVPARVVFGGEPAEAYLARTVPSFRAWRFAEASLPAGARILTFSGGDHLYSRTSRLWSDATAARAATWGTPAGAEEAALAALRELRVTHVLFDKRQIEDGSIAAIAIGSSAMRACCLALEYEDDRFALYRVREAEEDSGIELSSPSGTARQVCGMWNCPSIVMPGSTCRVVLPSHHARTAQVSASRATAVRQ